jgi:hypothetical protein
LAALAGGFQHPLNFVPTGFERQIAYQLVVALFGIVLQFIEAGVDLIKSCFYPLL